MKELNDAEKAAIEFAQQQKLSEAAIKFVTYINTQIKLLHRFGHGNSEFQFDDAVVISQKKIERDFFTWPEYDRESELSKLKNLSYNDGYVVQVIHYAEDGKIKASHYSSNLPLPINLNLVQSTKTAKDEVESFMMNCLLNVTLPDLDKSDPQLDYFKLFIENKQEFPDLFFTKDKFSGRIHTPVTSLSKEYRKQLLIDNCPVSSIDIKQMQPLVLSAFLQRKAGKNQFSDLINSGVDIYMYIKNALSLSSRDEAKEMFCIMINGSAKQTDGLKMIFGIQNWITRIKRFKSIVLPSNPHSQSRPYTNMAWLMQKMEVEIMRKVWKALMKENIKFLSVHDEIIIQTHHLPKGEALIKAILAKEFDFFQVTIDK